MSDATSAIETAAQDLINAVVTSVVPALKTIPTYLNDVSSGDQTNAAADVLTMYTDVVGAAASTLATVNGDWGAWAQGVNAGAVGPLNALQAFINDDQLQNALANAQKDYGENDTAALPADVQAIGDDTCGLLLDIGGVLSAIPGTAEIGLPIVAAALIAQSALDSGTLTLVSTAIGQMFAAAADGLNALLGKPPSGGAGGGSGSSGGETDAADPTGGHSAIAGAAAAMSGATKQIDPLVLDLTGTGINLTALSTESPYFDLTNDGYARKTAWAGSGTGFLALDPSGADITNGTQLVDSFAQLSQYDINGDGTIDASDAVFNQLRIWVDANGNGTTDPGELYTLSQLGITSINLTASTASASIAGNPVNVVSSYTLQDGSTREIAAVSLNNSATYTEPDVAVPVSATIAALPQLKGSGLMSDLRSSMMGDAALATLVGNLVSTPTGAAPSVIESDVQAILYEWAGISGVSSTSRGIYVNAQHLEFLEKYLGTPFNSLSTSDGENTTNPNFKAGASIDEAWNTIFNSLSAALTLQLPAQQSLVPEFTYDAATGLIQPATNLIQSLQGIQNRLGPVSASNLDQYVLALRVMDAFRLQVGLSQSAYESIVSAETNQTFASLANAVAFGQTVAIGADGSITETGTPLADTFYAGSGYTKFVGSGGGTNLMQPAASNDVFNYALGNGTVEISEIDPLGVTLNNQLVFGAGIRPSDIKKSIDAAGDITLTIAEGGEVILDSIASNPQDGVQSVIFQNGTVWNRSNILLNAVYYNNGTTGADTLIGKSGYPNVFDGKGGNDVETSSNGNDTFIFNPGYGTLTINESDSYQTNSILKLGAGIDPASVKISLGADRTSIVLTDGISGDQVTLTGMATNSANGVGTIQFANGTVWQRSQIIADAHYFVGTAGNDTLVGWAGLPNTFDGKGGNDVETSSNGNDTFIFNAGYGTLTINESDSYQTNSVLQLGAGIDPASVLVGRSADGGSIVLTDGISGDQVMLTGMATNSANGVGSIQFANGTVWQRSQILQAEQAGMNGTALIYGSFKADTFDSQGHTALEVGAGGNDTYLLQPGYSGITINNGVSTSNAALGDLQLGDVNPDNVWLQQVGNNLQVSIMGSTTEATIDNWFSNTYSQLSEVTVAGGSSGSLTLDSQVNQLIQAMATFSASNSGFDITSPTNATMTDTTLLAAVNHAWHH